MEWKLPQLLHKVKINVSQEHPNSPRIFSEISVSGFFGPKINEFIFGLIHTLGTVYVRRNKNEALGFNCVAIKIEMTFARVLKCFQVFVDYSFR